MLFSFFFYGCVDNLILVEETVKDQITIVEKTSFSISKQKAFKNLLDIIEILDNEEISTRSKSGKSLKSKVQNLTATDLVSVAQIRTRGTNNNEEMLYIVNFDDEDGYAVLSADERISDKVLSITEEGSLYHDDFFKICLHDTRRNTRRDRRI